MMRIDKYLWAVRLFKTRRLAMEACQKGNIELNGARCKPSKEIQPNDVIKVKQLPIWLVYKVLDIPKSRVGAKLVPELLENLTSEKDLEQLKAVQKMNRENHHLGFRGRPTKRDRRRLGDFLDGE